MAESRFVYVTYIRTTPEKLWHAPCGTRPTPSALDWPSRRRRLDLTRIDLAGASL